MLNPQKLSDAGQKIVGIGILLLIFNLLSLAKWILFAGMLVVIFAWLFECWE
jgi:hypothetical protein